MKINGFEFLPPQAQIYKNAADIEELKANQFILYKTEEELTNATVTIARADTNAGDADKGYLIDANGLLFKITGGDDDNLLLEYYSLLRV